MSLVTFLMVLFLMSMFVLEFVAPESPTRMPCEETLP